MKFMSAWAHPRAGGENTGELSGTFYQDGSSPRWRGKLCGFPRAGPIAGLIPALAGKTARTAAGITAQ